MKLSEIYQTPDDNWDEENDMGTVELSPKSSKLVNKHRLDKNHKYLGSGSYAYVGTNDDDNFGDVHRIANADDGGSMYLKYIADNPSIMDNPFFPKVREIASRSKTARDNHQVTIVERLLPFRTESIYQNGLLMKAIWSKYFTITPQEAVKKYNCSGTAATIPYIIRNALVGYYTDELKDKRLIESIHILAKISGAIGDAEPDIHQGNIMWRMAPYQPQLVITDPFVN